MTLKRDWPCDGCPDRIPGCHGSCSKYTEAKQDLKDREHKRKQAIYIVDSYQVDAVRRTTKKHSGMLVKNYRPKER